MSEKNDLYKVSSFDSIQPGQKLKIEHTVSLVRENINISELVSLPLKELERRYIESATAEKIIYEQLCAAVGKWDEQSAITQLLEKAIEYVKTPECIHSSNRWDTDKSGDQSVSNMVYKMTYHVYEETKYDHVKQASVPAAWQLTWSVRINPQSVDRFIRAEKIAGQESKRFTDKTVMEKYIQGRISAYSHLFTEISPPIPIEFAKQFMVNGLLLPGYTIADDSGKQADRTVSFVKKPESDLPSVLDKIS